MRTFTRRGAGSATPDTVLSLLVLEYEHLKEEQRLRIGTRDNLLYATFASFALIVAGATQTSSPLVLLLLPPASLALGWTYLVNDDRVTAIGAHIRNTLIPEFAALANTNVPLFSWEHEHRGDAGRSSRKRLQLTIDLLVFCAPMLAAPVLLWTTTPLPLALHPLLVAETAGFLLLARAFTQHATS